MLLSKNTHRIIGAHTSTQGGLNYAAQRGKNLGINGLQIFGASPVRWQANLPTQEEIDKFHIACKENGIKTVFLHAPYLINISSPKETLRISSKQLLTRHLEIASALGAQGVIFHIGSRGEMSTKTSREIVMKTISDILYLVPQSTLIMENNAGAGNLVGDTLEELGEIYKGVNNERFGICIDTAHAFASGMLPSFEKKNVEEFVTQFNKKIGLKALWVIHLNDSKVPAGSKKDRHENIGEGFIGKVGLQNFITHQKLVHIPLILEVPGFDGKGPDKKNIDIVKELTENRNI